jgi:transcriptional regulator with XRE-family HTH domain
MKLGEKISKLRKNCNYTQEQLAEILGVSRQSISKWESGISYPETDKLIRMGKLFACSMDYLLNEDVTEKGGTHALETEISPNRLKLQFRERKSEKTICGMPLYHIGKNAHGFFAVGFRAKGVFSIGLLSRGIVSLGLLSIGLLPIGLLSLGLVALGTWSIGLLAFGAIALGLFAVGAIAIGILSFGALSVGCFSAGALAIGKYIAVGDHAQALIAIGKSTAEGSVYRYIGELHSADFQTILALLDANVPPALAWAKEIFKLFIG